MALIRGLRGLFPCPICFVKSDEQSDVTVVPEARSMTHSHSTIQKARTLNAEGREDLLKGSGLRNVDVSFCILLNFFVSQFPVSERVLEYCKLRSSQGDLL